MAEEKEDQKPENPPQGSGQEPKKGFHLGEILIRNKWVSWEQLEQALEIQRATGRRIGEILVEKNFVHRKNLSRALALQKDRPFVDFDKYQVTEDALKLIPADFAKKNRVIPLIKKNGICLVAINNPRGDWPAEEVKKIIGDDAEVRPVVADDEDLGEALKKYYGASG